MAFERFVKTRKSYKPKISIRKNGQIGLNFSAMEEFSIKQYKYAVLLYDKEDQKIGIKLTNDTEDGVIKIIKRSTDASISARAFLDYYHLPYELPKKQDIKFDKDEAMIVIQL